MLPTTCPHCHQGAEWTLWGLLPGRVIPASFTCGHCGARVRMPGWWHCVSLTATLAISVWLAVSITMAFEIESVPLEILVLAAIMFPLQIATNLLYLFAGGRLVADPIRPV